ncbi:MAG: hypothetical protein IJ379_09020 [Lachnospiraceae bacterium]|nr:hypothetical protein [Lachnospiraceae bacterium]
MFHKKKTYYMDIKSADTALQKIFAACDRTPNSVPFDKLVLRQQARTKAYDVLLWVIALIITVTILSPLAFVGFQTPADSRSIALINHYVKNDKLYVIMDTGNHTIRYDEAYITSYSGSIYEVVSYDSKTRSLCFPYISQGCKLYIPYDNDSLLELALTPNTLKENN